MTVARTAFLQAMRSVANSVAIVVFGEVLNVRAGYGKPLAYLDGRYGSTALISAGTGPCVLAPGAEPLG